MPIFIPAPQGPNIRYAEDPASGTRVLENVARLFAQAIQQRAALRLREKERGEDLSLQRRGLDIQQERVDVAGRVAGAQEKAAEAAVLREQNEAAALNRRFGIAEADQLANFAQGYVNPDGSFLSIPQAVALRDYFTNPTPTLAPELEGVRPIDDLDRHLRLTGQTREDAQEFNRRLGQAQLATEQSQGALISAQRDAISQETTFQGRMEALKRATAVSDLERSRLAVDIAREELRSIKGTGSLADAAKNAESLGRIQAVYADAGVPKDVLNRAINEGKFDNVEFLPNSRLEQHAQQIAQFANWPIEAARAMVLRDEIINPGNELEARIKYTEALTKGADVEREWKRARVLLSPEVQRTVNPIIARVTDNYNKHLAPVATMHGFSDEAEEPFTAQQRARLMTGHATSEAVQATLVEIATEMGLDEVPSKIFWTAEEATDLGFTTFKGDIEGMPLKIAIPRIVAARRAMSFLRSDLISLSQLHPNAAAQLYTIPEMNLALQAVGLELPQGARLDADDEDPFKSDLALPGDD